MRAFASWPGWKTRSDVKAPRIPKRLSIATLSQDYFHADEEYVGLRFDGGQMAFAGLERVEFQRTRFEDANLDGSVLYSPKLTDVAFKSCSLANVNFERLIAHRIEFSGCRLLGLNVTDGYFQNAVFRDCDLQLARFRFTTFDTVMFDDCILTEANFQGADLSGVNFVKCNLNNAELSQTKLGGTDFRTSSIEGIRVGPEEVIGAVVDHFQAAYMASLLGLVIRKTNEE